MTFGIRLLKFCAEMKAMSVFKDSPLARQGRLSVVPLTKAQWAAVLEAGER